MPILALPSLQKLRSLLAEGIVLLDCQAQSLLELVGRLRETFHFLGISPKVLESSRAYPTPSYPRDCPFLTDSEGKAAACRGTSVISARDRQRQEDH